MELVALMNAQASVPVSQLDVSEALKGIAHEFVRLPGGKLQATNR